MMSAKWMKARNTRSSLSNRLKIRRKPFSLRNRRSTVGPVHDQMTRGRRRTQCTQQLLAAGYAVFKRVR
jgi:hypothetical protein